MNCWIKPKLKIIHTSVEFISAIRLVVKAVGDITRWQIEYLLSMFGNLEKNDESEKNKGDLAIMP